MAITSRFGLTLAEVRDLEMWEIDELLTIIRKEQR